MDGTEPSDDLKKGGGLAASPPFALKGQIGALDRLVLLFHGMGLIVEMISRVSGSCRLLLIASICSRVLPEHNIYFDDELNRSTIFELQ